MKLENLVATVAVSVGTIFGAAPSLSGQTANQIDTLVRTSHVIFVGRVEKVRAANLRAVSPTDSTILVKVEDPLDVPPSIASLKNEEVTVEVAHAGELKPGETQVFFTNGLVFGEHLEVKEVGHVSPPANTAELQNQILAVRAQIAQETLQARVTSALLIVAGKVLEVKSLPRVGPISEHQGDWAEALIQVESVEKGSWRERAIAVDFPQSTDERWLLSPKFKVGQTGIWLLRHQENVGLPASAWVALNHLDFQLSDRVETIHKLLR